MRKKAVPRLIGVCDLHFLSTKAHPSGPRTPLLAFYKIFSFFFLSFFLNFAFKVLDLLRFQMYTASKQFYIFLYIHFQPCTSFEFSNLYYTSLFTYCMLK